MSKRPHIVLFNPDHYRGDVLNHLGNAGAVTPQLDRLVHQEGAVSFQKAYCQNPVCVPSRCSFMSGWYPHVRGHRTMAHMMHEGENVILKTLKDAGYWVWWGARTTWCQAMMGTTTTAMYGIRPLSCRVVSMATAT